jgi:hypothetical protein
MKREVGVFHSNTKPWKFFGTLSIHLAFRSLSLSTQFPCEKGSEQEEPRSSRRLDCGDGQTSDGRTTLEENLSFYMERDVHHHGNCCNGLVNSIPFVKKSARDNLGDSGGVVSLHLRLRAGGRGRLWSATAAVRQGKKQGSPTCSLGKEDGGDDGGGGTRCRW